MKNAADYVAKGRQKVSTLRFLGIFALLALAGFAIEIVPWVDTNVVAPLTEGITWVCAKLILAFGGVAQVHSNVIQYPGGFSIRVSNGCSGLEGLILLFSAILAFPAKLAYKALGLLLGTVAIMGLNIVRVISLYYLGQYSTEWFNWAHLYAWDVLIMIDGLVVFILWLRQIPRGH
ncbi:exosortase H [Paucibacter sp. DJ2R-2]|uniref:exosortase H n=1 Tax=Paucibacter sp. DJ2R-2 TaxID=2893558 RepID=UPI0021E37335|nr:exosortase H [Paucibacter sp. DJ2R-2]MCV2419222.1 exosortase H [Paucibacter sp. DJ4R-1]MCV2437823.1 exosortase H [Paucibacter sp. DJ2R-2]